MENLVIEGGVPLKGTVSISGAKNAALPILCSSLLTDGPCTFRNVPALRDIDTTAALLRYMGADVEVDAPRVRVRAGSVQRAEAPYEQVKQMRA